MPQLLRKGLMEAGLPEERITIIIDEQEAVAYALNKAKSGDLLMVFGDAITRCWKQIINFKPEQDEEVETQEPVASSLPTPNPSFAMAMDQFESLIIDERGARLASRAPRSSIIKDSNWSMAMAKDGFGVGREEATGSCVSTSSSCSGLKLMICFQQRVMASPKTINKSPDLALFNA